MSRLNIKLEGHDKTNFWTYPAIEELMQTQGITPVTNFDMLLGGWPDDEPIDDFIKAVSHWRESDINQDET